MKDVYLFGPTIVRAGETQSVRHPHENPISVSDAEADRLEKLAVLAPPTAKAEPTALVLPEND
ncbi:hypothetical protein [uncultured Sphingomonas sp.]|uniref:hypothetical protein n=1 Tax=uncultured Sphingomonas sp. TaxID=158754 RepID=UPI0025E1D133|nr:hypothetical protein [uncultured Sphingomonas sp.]